VTRALYGGLFDLPRMMISDDGGAGMKVRILASWMIVALAAAMTTACDSDTTGPDPQSEGVSFTVGSIGQHTARGTPHVAGGDVLNSEFAIARADSVDGFALISFDPTGNDVGNLFVLQAPRSGTPDQDGSLTFACGLGHPCHGRFVVGVKAGNTLTADRWFEISEGTVRLTQVGPDRLKGTFSVTFQALDDQPGGTITVENGTIDVPYSADQVTDGALECLLAIVGVRPGTCRG
jgi:hypothetical protein